MTWLRGHPVVTFFVVTFVVAWAFVPFGSFGAFAPLLGALVVAPLCGGRAGLRELGSRLIRWRVGWYWYAVAFGLPLGVHVVTAILGIPAVGAPSVTLSSVGSFLLVFAIRLVNPLDGPLGEEPGWRGFALPGLQARLSPLAATAILAVVVTVWHVPLVFFEEGGTTPTFLIYFTVTTVAVTFWYSWLFNHTRGSVLLVLIAHSVEGSIQTSGPVLIYTGVWVVVALGLVLLDLQHWRGRAPAEAQTSRSADRPEITFS
jgi:membrane protease YdiL (CAAX protease family)